MEKENSMLKPYRINLKEQEFNIIVAIIDTTNDNTKLIQELKRKIIFLQSA